MIEIAQILSCLSRKRPIFHSEADFQHAVAWQIQLSRPDVAIRLEIRPPGWGKGDHIDIWCESDESLLALELKYIKQKFEVTLGTESYSLAYHNAGDVSRYAFIKDFSRLEQISLRTRKLFAYAVLLTNDKSFWEPPQTTGHNYDAFRVHEGHRLSGILGWAPNSGNWTSKLPPITLTQTYKPQWGDFSQHEGKQHGKFRHLAIAVRPGACANMEGGSAVRCTE